MILKEIYTTYIKQLSSIYEKGEAEAITKIAIEYFTKIELSKILINGDKIIDTNIYEKLEDALVQLLKNKPIQYITGYCWFYNLQFKVNEHVLIPRTETEELVFEIISKIKKNNFKKIIDIGTGSGCIPISIKKNVIDATVTAIDVSKDALLIAKQNAVLNNVTIKFKEIDFLNESQYNNLETFDVIISNPPYIPENEKNSLAKNVTDYEPLLALFVPQNDPLLFYKKILIFAETHLNKDGFIFLETHENFAKETAKLFVDKNYNVVIKKDMQEKERMLIINQNL